jgi:hypothetical protein
LAPSPTLPRKRGRGNAAANRKFSLHFKILILHSLVA